MCELSANIQELMNCARATEEAPNFDFYDWILPCGTHGCLVGNHMIRLGESRELVSEFSERYDIPDRLYQWLFIPDREGIDRPQALRKLRKAIYYICHKREQCPPREAKEDREQYDLARRTGHVGISELVTAQLA